MTKFDNDKFYRENPLHVHDQVERHEKIASLCKGTVVDIGCGTGSLTEYYKGKYYGVDISKVAIEKARKHRREDAQFAIEDCEKTKHWDFKDCNTIVMAEFLEHIENDDLIFEAIKKTATMGTRIIISVPNHDRVQSPDHVREFTVAKMRKKYGIYGNVKFRNWIGSLQRIIMTIDVWVPQEKTLTLGIIAKNEGKGIENAILTCMEYTHEIVVLVDSVTTDETEKIARRYTDKVHLFKWENNFSKARNDLLECVTTPWVLFIDGHEYLEKYKEIQFLNDSKNDAYLCSIRVESGSVVRYPRLHRKELRYENQVHNKLVCKNAGVSNDIVFVHDRIEAQSKESTAEREKQRDEMVIGIMGKEIKENKKSTRASLHLALHYHARNKFKKAFKYYKLYLKHGTYAPERWFVRFNIALLYAVTGKPIRAEHQAMKMEGESPNRWETNYLRGTTLLDQKKYTEAIEYFLKSLQVTKQECEYKPIPRNHSLTWNNIGEAFFKLQKYQEASEAFKRSSELSKDVVLKGLAKRRSQLMANIAKN